MPFNFPNPKTTDPRQRAAQRTMEIIPGFLTWFTIIGMFVFSFFVPAWMAVFIIVFDVYWIFRTIYIVTYSVSGYRKLRAGEEIDWWERCQNIASPAKYKLEIEEKDHPYEGKPEGKRRDEKKRGKNTEKRKKPLGRLS